MFFLCAGGLVLLVVHVDRVPQRERDDLLAVRRAVGPDEGVQAPVDGRLRLAAVLQVEQVQVGLGAVHLARGQRRGRQRPGRGGGDELLQRLAAVTLQVQSQSLGGCGGRAARRLESVCSRQNNREVDKTRSLVSKHRL